MSANRPYLPRIYTVQGITANLRALSGHFGVQYQVAHARMFKCGWTVEQALGLAPRPPPKPRGNRVCATALVNGPRLAPAGENFLHACLRLLTAEEYLRLEGVPLNEHPPLGTLRGPAREGEVMSTLTSETRGGWWRRLKCLLGRHDWRQSTVNGRAYVDRTDYHCFWCGHLLMSVSRSMR